MSINAALRFYRDAYQHEYRAQAVSDFLSRSVSHHYYPSDFDLLRTPDYGVPVPRTWGEAAYAELKLSSSEKKLVVGAFFVKGKIDLLGKRRKLFAPLFLMDARLEPEDETYVVRVHRDTLAINPTAAEYLDDQCATASGDPGERDASELLSFTKFDFGALVELSDHLGANYGGLDLRLMDARLDGDGRTCDLKRAHDSRSPQYDKLLLPDIALGIVTKPAKSRGVIGELDELATREIPRASILGRLFGEGRGQRAPRRNTRRKSAPLAVPVSLSEEQRHVIRAATEAQLSIAIGPPGTGKSFTIAALAVQAAYEGKSVLIAAKTEEACRVIARKILSDIGVKSVAPSMRSSRALSNAKWSVDRLARGIGVRSASADDDLPGVERRIRQLQQALEQVTTRLDRRAREELDWGERLASDGEGLLDRLRLAWIKYRHGSRSQMWTDKFILHRDTSALREQQRALIELTQRQRKRDGLASSRSDFTRLSAAYGQRRGNAIARAADTVDFGAVLRALPIWICTSGDVAEALPLSSGLFDLVVIDEASQCDIASALPLLYRAKSALVVGDPKQLGHVSFLSRAVEASLRAKHAVEDASVRYRDRSVLDLVNASIDDQDAVAFLREHYRSLPDIIDFPNREFYGGELAIMTSNPIADASRNLVFRQVAGTRDPKGANVAEAEALIARIVALVVAEYDTPQRACSSIGVVSPFQAQVQLLKRRVREALTATDIAKHDVLVGTPYAFQGEERDRVYLSFAVDPESHPTSFRYLDREDVFNVAITRARFRQEVFLSVPARELSPTSLLYRYLARDRRAPLAETPARSPFDGFMAEVLAFLGERGYAYEVNGSVSGVLLDIVVVAGDRLVAIDLVGYPGMYEARLSLESIRRMERVDVDIFLLPYSAWVFDREGVKAHLSDFLSNLRPPGNRPALSPGADA